MKSEYFDLAGADKPLRVLAIDPGPTESAMVDWNGEEIGLSMKEKNELILERVRKNWQDCTLLAIEQIKSYGMKVSDSVFDTVFWTGRFWQAWKGDKLRVPRMSVKMHLCHDSRAKDGNIRQALIDRLGPPGVKAKKGITYGLKGDEWQALALAVYCFDVENGSSKVQAALSGVSG